MLRPRATSALRSSDGSRNSRTGAADPFRLTTLLERYDSRVNAANKSAWLRTFTQREGRGAGDGRQDESGPPLPRSHTDALLSLGSPKLKLDVAVLLAVRAAFRSSIPRQVLVGGEIVVLCSHHRRWIFFF